ncbi:hypothetical protein SPHINGO361_140163 [Sphingomonas sp. EC-HK361]|nr:hypothetical protein SPHINGO361_140163 [Sphingomonas sp. EC-HK361]
MDGKPTKIAIRLDDRSGCRQSAFPCIFALNYLQGYQVGDQGIFGDLAALSVR